MKNSKQFDVAEGVFKHYGRRRTRKHDYKRVRPETAPLWKLLLRRGLWVLEGRIEKPIPRRLQDAIESSLEDRSEFLKFEPPALRVELANFIGWMTAAGVDAAWAEAEFFRLRRQGTWPRIPREGRYDQLVFHSADKALIERAARRVKFDKIATE